MPTKALVVVLALLAVAFGIYTLAGGDEAGPAPLAPPATPIAHGASATTAAIEAAKVAAAPVSDAAAVPADSGRVAAPTNDRGPAGATVMLRGRLVDGAGAPRPGTGLALRTWEGTEDLEFLPPPPRSRDRGADLPTWTTRADGTFEIPLPKNRLGHLELVDDTLVFAAERAPIVGSKGDQDLGDLAVLRGGALLGVVQDERGQPAAGVKVAIVLGALGFGSSNQATSGADGTFTLGRLRAGKCTLRTASGKFLPTSLELELGPEERREGVVLVVKPGNAIAGQVVDDRGVGVAGMKVGSRRKESQGSLDIERFSPDEATTTDAHGYFTLSGLADEVAAVRAFGPGHTSASAGDVQVGTGNLVLRVERLGAVEGVLVAVDGTPIAGSRVRAQGGGEPMDGLHFVDAMAIDAPMGPGAAVTGADGSFRVESVRPGNVTVVASGKTHRPARQTGVAVRPAQATKGVRLVADAGASARLLVVDESGRPVAGAKVVATRSSSGAMPGGATFRARAVAVEDRDGEMTFGMGGTLGSATTDAEGRATIAGLPGGNLSFGASHGDFAPAVAVRVDVPKSGAVEASLTMRKPGVAEITVLGTDGAPQSGLALQVQAVGDGDDGQPRRVVSGEAGLARVTALAPGDYEAALARSPSGGRVGDAMVWMGAGGETIAASRQRFTVVGGETTRVELRRPVLAKVHGVVTGADGPAVGVQVALRSDSEDGPDLPGIGGRQATSGADGTFAFDDVEAGAYVLDYGKRDQVVKAQAAVAVPVNATEVRRDLELRTGRVRVQVVAAGSGEGVAKAEVELVRAGSADTGGGAPPRQERRVMMVTMSLSSDGAGGEEITTKTAGAPRAHADEDGIAEIDDVPVGEYTLRVRHKKHAPRELKNQVVAERQLTDCGRVELALAGMVRGKVVDAGGKPAPMAMVASRPADGQQWSEPEMAQGGGYRLSGLAAGRYLVRAQAIGVTPGGFSPEVEVTVVAGETAVADLQLPAK